MAFLGKEFSAVRPPDNFLQTLFPEPVHLLYVDGYISYIPVLVFVKLLDRVQVKSLGVQFSNGNGYLLRNHIGLAISRQKELIYAAPLTQLTIDYANTLGFLDRSEVLKQATLCAWQHAGILYSVRVY